MFLFLVTEREREEMCPRREITLGKEVSVGRILLSVPFYPLDYRLKKYMEIFIFS
jgi:hypothetical protein